MSNLVDDMLKSIPDEMVLNESAQPWIKKLLEGLNTALIELEIESEYLCMAATGKSLKDAIKKLPTTRQISLLNDSIISFGKQHRREADRIEREEHAQAMLERQVRLNLIKCGGIVFMFLITVFVLAIVVISWKQDTVPDTEIASGLFSTLIQILKLIFNVS